METFQLCDSDECAVVVTRCLDIINIFQFNYKLNSRRRCNDIGRKDSYMCNGCVRASMLKRWSFWDWLEKDNHPLQTEMENHFKNARMPAISRTIKFSISTTTLSFTVKRFTSTFTIKLSLSLVFEFEHRKQS